jgi:hypothetical protein
MKLLRTASLAIFATASLATVVLSAWCFSTRPRWVLVRDGANRPIAGVKLTLTSSLGESVTTTDESGYAYLDRRRSEAPGQLVMEKVGHATKTMRYPGKVSLLENLYEPDKASR